MADPGEGQKAEFMKRWWREAIGHEPRPYQRKILLHDGPLIVTKARQVGISTTMACLAVYEAALGGRKVLIASNSEEAAQHILNDYCPAFDGILSDYGLVERPVTDRKSLCQWVRGGEIRTFSSNPATVRGYPANLVILDEFAHFTREAGADRRLLEAIGPSVSQAGGRLIILSTPHGTLNEFYRIWSSPDTLAGNKIMVRYSENPDLRVREEAMAYGRHYVVEGLPRPLRPEEFAQEYNCEFLEGEGQAIPMGNWERAIVADAEAWE